MMSHRGKLACLWIFQINHTLPPSPLQHIVEFFLKRIINILCLDLFEQNVTRPATICHTAAVRGHRYSRFAVSNCIFSIWRKYSGRRLFNSQPNDSPLEKIVNFPIKWWKIYTSTARTINSLVTIVISITSIPSYSAYPISTCYPCFPLTSWKRSSCAILQPPPPLFFPISCRLLKLTIWNENQT